MNLIVVLMWLTVCIGWVLNICQVIGMALAGAELSALLFLKVLGIPLGPLGCILGWVQMFI